MTDFKPQLVNAVSGEEIVTYQNRRFAPEFSSSSEHSAVLPLRDISEFAKTKGVNFTVEGQKLVLESGIHDFTKTISIPREYMLEIEAGAKLRMGPGVSVWLIIKGGTADDHVTILPLKPEGLPWGTFSVVLATLLMFHISLFLVERSMQGWHLSFWPVKLLQL